MGAQPAFDPGEVLLSEGEAGKAFAGLGQDRIAGSRGSRIGQESVATARARKG